MTILYAVPWIEVEFGWGSRPEGFKVFDSLEECIKNTKERFADGDYGTGYFGPVSPLCYYETPDEIEGPYPRFVDSLKFKSNAKPIT